MFSLLAYFGPETVMPMTSIVATVAAMAMMFGKTIFRIAFGWLMLLRRVSRRGNGSAAGPHFTLRPQQGRTSEASFEDQAGELVER